LNEDTITQFVKDIKDGKISKADPLAKKAE
jgi:hypothetical protein